MKDEGNQQKPLSREKWLELAMEALSTKGVSKFNLDTLLKEMPVSKGSFYWHFENRAEFLAALVEYWDRHDTKSVVDALEALSPATSAADKLWELMCEVYELKYSRNDLLMRSLILEYPELGKAVAAADKTRYATVRRLFAEMGFAGDELDMRALAFVSITSMDQHLLLDISPENYKRQLKLRHEFFIRH